MLSLRTFHIAFILIVMIAADMFGAWAVWNYRHDHDPVLLIVGILSFLFGFALVVYVIWLVRKLDRAKVE